MIIFIVTFDGNDIDITFHRFSDVAMKNYAHCTLVRCSSIL